MYFQPLWLTVLAQSIVFRDRRRRWFYGFEFHQNLRLMAFLMFGYLICILWAPCETFITIFSQHYVRENRHYVNGKMQTQTNFLKTFMTLNFVKTWRLRLSLYQEIILVCEQCVDVCHRGKNCYLCTAMAWEKEFRTDRMSDQTC